MPVDLQGQPVHVQVTNPPFYRAQMPGSRDDAVWGTRRVDPLSRGPPHVAEVVRLWRARLCRPNSGEFSYDRRPTGGRPYWRRMAANASSRGTPGSPASNSSSAAWTAFTSSDSADRASNASWSNSSVVP